MHSKQRQPVQQNRAGQLVWLAQVKGKDLFHGARFPPELALSGCQIGGQGDCGRRLRYIPQLEPNGEFTVDQGQRQR